MGNLGAGLLYALATLLIIAWTWITWCNWVIYNENAKSTTVKPSYLKGEGGSELLGFVDSLSLTLLNWAGFAMLILVSVGGIYLMYLSWTGTDVKSMVKANYQGMRNAMVLDPAQFKQQPQMQQPQMQQQYAPQMQYTQPQPMSAPAPMQV